MKHEAHAIFEQYQRDLEHEPGRWACRLFDAENSGGLVWRNGEHCAAGDEIGFFPSPTIPWKGVESYFTADALAELNRIYAEAFNSDVPIKRRIRFGNADNECAEWICFYAVFGDMNHGVIVTRSSDEREVCPRLP